jgi:HEAT repeat protein
VPRSRGLPDLRFLQGKTRSPLEEIEDSNVFLPREGFDSSDDMGEKDVQYLKPKLSSTNKEERLAALERLHILLREKELDSSLLPQLSLLLTAEDPIERRMASWAIGKLAQNKVHGDYPLSKLIDLLMDEDEEVRENATWSLGELTSSGIGGENEIKSLNLLLEDPHPQVRGMAAWTLGRLAERLGIGHYSSVPPLRRMLEDHSLNARKSAIYALERLTALGIKDDWAIYP